ncbi:FadR/GntR family transcriptional regulator [Paenibacillus sp. 1P07SE]|uniref:FadR/GntR family transcriptional regulator n=1 Tax=Paenibacillus sp. 1P07SE TaxID=3132209 RepID=UPI0039A5A009
MMEHLGQRPLKNSEWVMQDLLRQLNERELAPGDRLPSVVDLAARYGVGRSTIREALSAIKAMGRLDIRQGGGTFVIESPTPPPHPAQLQPEAWLDRSRSLRHILEVRQVLETGAALLAASHRTEADLEQLRQTLAEMEAELDDERAGEQADIRFHLQIAAATCNPVIADLMASLSGRLHESMKDTRALWFYSERSSSERLLREHRAIYEAIAAGDGPEAARLMGQHIAKVEQVLDERGATSP